MVPNKRWISKFNTMTGASNCSPDAMYFDRADPMSAGLDSVAAEAGELT
jgi:hypothetical protein